MENSVTSILTSLEDRAKERGDVDWHLLMAAAEKINALLQSEQDTLADMEYQLAKMKAAYLSEGKSVAYANTMIEATDEYLAAKKQKILIERALETVKIAKKMAQLSSDTARSY